MSVYNKADAAAFLRSLSSVAQQNHPPNEILLVCDGPLTLELEEVILAFKDAHPTLLKLHRLEKHQGLGFALQKGIEACCCEYILRMDADDYAVPERSQLQLNCFLENPSFVIVGGQLLERNIEKNTVAIKKVPLTSSEIFSYSRKRNPFNHMTVCFRKSVVLKAGNYEPMPYFEDYWLWLRMLDIGNGSNLPDVLVEAEAGDGLFYRRGGISYVKAIWKFQIAFHKSGRQTFLSFLKNSILRSVVALLPCHLRKKIYQRFLREI